MSKQIIVRHTLSHAVIFVTVLSICTGNALAAGSYGTIAFSPSTGGNGYAFGLASVESAEQVAISECEKYSHSGDCLSVVTTNKGCAALAVGVNSYGSAQGVDQNAAQYAALKNCQSAGSGENCRIIRWLCH